MEADLLSARPARETVSPFLCGQIQQRGDRLYFLSHAERQDHRGLAVSSTGVLSLCPEGLPEDHTPRKIEDSFGGSGLSGHDRSGAREPSGRAVVSAPPVLQMRSRETGSIPGRAAAATAERL